MMTAYLVLSQMERPGRGAPHTKHDMINIGLAAWPLIVNKRLFQGHLSFELLTLCHLSVIVLD